MKRAYEKPQFAKAVVTLQAVTAVPVNSAEPRRSDARLKTGIREVGRTSHNLPLYHFCYLDEVGRFEGVIAQDVLKAMPDAVSIGSDGFYRVDYRMLGIEMKRIS